MDLFNLLFIQTQKGNLIAQCTHKYFHPIIQIQYYTVPEQTPSKLKKLKKIGGVRAQNHSSIVIQMKCRSWNVPLLTFVTNGILGFPSVSVTHV